MGKVLKLCVFLSVRKILAPGEEENLELEEEEDAAAGAGSTEAFPQRAPGIVTFVNNPLKTVPRLGRCVILSCF